MEKKKKNPVTSIQVAKLANVSQSAVSRTFTAGASVAPATKARVLAAAKALGYRPNVIARSLISGQSKTVGLVVAYLENHFYPLMIQQLSHALQADGYHVLLFMAESGQQDAVIEQILQYQIDGVVLASVTLSSHIAEECANIGVPVVLFNRYVPDEVQASTVTSNNEAGGRLVAQRLVQAGHKRISFVAGNVNSSTNQDRERGFIASLNAEGIELWSTAIGKYRFLAAAEATREILAKKPYPDAIFVANDHMAFAVMDVIRDEYKLRIPEDIAVVGFDNVPESNWGAYSLTTVEQPLTEMVAATAEILLQQMKDKKVTPTHKVFDTQLIVRKSAEI